MAAAQTFPEMFLQEAPGLVSHPNPHPLPALPRLLGRPGPAGRAGRAAATPRPHLVWRPPRPHLLGCSEERREEAELRRDLRPGVAGVGALAGAGCRTGAAAAGGETVLPGLELVCPASSRPPADFRLDFLHISVFYSGWMESPTIKSEQSTHCSTHNFNGWTLCTLRDCFTCC